MIHFQPRGVAIQIPLLSMKPEWGNPKRTMMGATGTLHSFRFCLKRAVVERVVVFSLCLGIQSPSENGKVTYCKYFSEEVIGHPNHPPR